MTIRIERQALLRVINTSSSPIEPHLPPILPTNDEDEFVIVDLPPEKKQQQQLLATDNDFFDSPTKKSLRSTDSTEVPVPEEDDVQTYVSSFSSDCTDDEDDDSTSLSTLSTQSRVSFASELVSDVWTRPYTPTEDIPSLFYSSDTIAQFRHEYRLERKVLSELAVDPETLTNVDEEELSSLFSLPTSPSSSYDASPSSDSSSYSASPMYKISRVVVVHNDKLETFFNPAEQTESKSDDSEKLLPSSCSSSSSSLPLSESFCLGLQQDVKDFDRQGQLSSQQQQQQQPNFSLCSTTSSTDQPPAADFFDNDSFWNGSLTWY